MTDLAYWERLSDLREGSLPPHQRNGTAAPSTPSARLYEVQRELDWVKQALAEACTEIRRLQRRIDDQD